MDRRQKMFGRKLKWICIIILIVSMIIVPTAFSFWQVDFSASTTSDIKIDQDDIAENYSFNGDSKKYNLKNYTIYLFPSTIYLNLYLDYLDGKTDTKPEDTLGFIYPVLEEDGSIAYDANGMVQYESSNENGDEAYLEDYLRAGGSFEKNYLTKDEGQIESYYKDVYEENNWLELTGAPTYEYGDPIFDETQVSYKKYTGYEEQHNYRNLHRYDRFGYWPTLAKDSGRYLPLKISVDQNFSSGFYEEVVKRPLADMGDPIGWYCYSFTLWSYVSIEKDEDGNRIGYHMPYYASDDFISNLTTSNKKFYGDGTKVNPALSSFCPTAVSQYFDLMGDFSIYADEEGIIRLFPKFSNGKTYDETSGAIDTTGNTSLPCGFLNGGTDAMRMTPTYKDSSVFEQHDFYFSYLTELEEFNNAQNIGVGVLPNVLIDKYSNLEFQISTSVGYANWGGNWENVFEFSQSMIESTIASYGEGFYNVYLFIENIASSGTSTTSNLGQLISTLRVSDYEAGLFPSLAGKNFFEPTSSTLVNKKSVVIALEKVRDMRIIMNIPSSVSEGDLSFGYEVTNQYFRYLSEDVYSTTAGLNIVENIESVRPINDRYQYCYILNGVDFTNAYTSAFQIRFQKRYREDLLFSGTGGVSGDIDLAPNVDLIYNPKIVNHQGEFSKEQRFINAFEYYFNAEVKQIVNENNSMEEQVVFHLKSEEYKGVYDLMLIYIPQEYYTAIVENRTVIYTEKKDLPNAYVTHAAGFYMFAYRQTNVFLKIFANDLTEHYALPPEDENVGLNGFLIHSKSFKNNMLLYQKEYALGVAVRDTDINEGIPDYSVEYLSYQQPSIGNTLSYCLNTYIKEWMEKKTSGPTTIERLILRDHVTGAIVASYQKVREEEFLQADSELWYLENGNYYKLVFENFYIQKNYVFYLTWI